VYVSTKRDLKLGKGKKSSPVNVFAEFVRPLLRVKNLREDSFGSFPDLQGKGPGSNHPKDLPGERKSSYHRKKEGRRGGPTGDP